MLPSKKERNYYAIVMFAVMSYLLWGCHRHYTPLPEPPKLPSRVGNACDPNITEIKDALRASGIQVIEMGQMHLLSIPTYILFPDQSPRLTWESYDILNRVVCYLRSYRKIKTTITTFASPYVSFLREKALTKARSESVAHYLWNQDIKSQMVVTRGQGSEKPIVASLFNGDRAMNSRVEITFKEEI